jgi:hypothetical protein
MSVKALKRALKKAGLKTSGRKSALTKRAKKAHLLRGGTVSGSDKTWSSDMQALNGQTFTTKEAAEAAEAEARAQAEAEEETEADDSSTMGGASAKSLRRALKKAGLKTTGRKSTLSKRAKKAGLKVGGGDE